LEFKRCCFCGGRKIERTQRKPSEQGENQKQVSVWWRALLPLRHDCSPQFVVVVVVVVVVIVVIVGGVKE